MSCRKSLFSMCAVALVAFSGCGDRPGTSLKRSDISTKGQALTAGKVEKGLSECLSASDLGCAQQQVMSVSTDIENQSPDLKTLRAVYQASEHVGLNLTQIESVLSHADVTAGQKLALLATSARINQSEDSSPSHCALVSQYEKVENMRDPSSRGLARFQLSVSLLAVLLAQTQDEEGKITPEALEANETVDLSAVPEGDCPEADLGLFDGALEQLEQASATRELGTQVRMVSDFVKPLSEELGGINPLNQSATYRAALDTLGVVKSE